VNTSRAADLPAENQNRDCLERAHATQLSAKNSSVFYTKALRRRGQSWGNINRGARLEGAGITGSIAAPADFLAGRSAPTLKLIAMPNRRPPSSARAPRANFRERYAALETRRAELVARLATLDQSARRHPGYRRALTLLNNTFRKEKLPQRLAVL